MNRSRVVFDAPCRRGTRWMLCLLIVCVCLTGCVRRRMTIRSNPPGASVYIDDQEVGTTPVSVDFTYYGTRKIQLIKDGYETLVVQQPFFAPWYQWPVIDFVSENLSPVEHVDEHLLSFQLEPQQILPADRLLERAQELRVSAGQGYVAALPNAAGSPQPVVPLDYPSWGSDSPPPPAILPAPAPPAVVEP